jgi:hypothetical protein
MDDGADGGGGEARRRLTPYMLEEELVRRIPELVMALPGVSEEPRIFDVLAWN